MRIRLLACLALILVPLIALADHSSLRNDEFNANPVNSSGQTTASFPTQLREWLDHEVPQWQGRTFSPYVYSGGTHATAGGLTSASFATEAFVPERVNQTSTAITYAAAANDVCWTIVSSDNNGIATWTRVGTTAYYYQCQGSTTPVEPTLPANSAWLMRITVTGSAIAAVADWRNTNPVKRYQDVEYITCTDNVTTDSALISGAISRLLMRRGGILELGPGVCNLNVAQSIAAASGSLNKGVTIRGAGSSEAGLTNAPTVVKWTGGASIVFDVGTDARNVTFERFDFENTGTATAFIRFGWTGRGAIRNLNMRPTTFPSTAGVILGVGANRIDGMLIENTVIRGATATDVCLAADRVHDLRVVALQNVNCKTTLGIVGSVDVVNAQFFGSSFSNGPNADVVVVNQARNLVFNGSHFENDGTGYAIDIPGAGGAESVTCFGCYFSGLHNGNSTTGIIQINNSATVLRVYDSYALQYANGTQLVRNLANAGIILIGNNLSITTGSLSTDFTIGSLWSLGNMIANDPTADRLAPNVGASQCLYIGNTNNCIKRVLIGSATRNLAAPGAVPGVVTTTVTVTGAAVGDPVFIGVAAAPPAGYLAPTAAVTATDTVTVYQTQISGGATDPDGSGGEYKAYVFKN